MILDIGNTRAKVAVVEGGRVCEVVATATAQPQPSGHEAATAAGCRHDDGELRRAVDELCHRYDVRAAIASVVGAEPDFALLLPERLHGRFHRLSYKSQLPIAIDYDTPQTLGMDRVAAVVGARQLQGQGPLVVVDAGSCITVDLLDGTDTYRGGAILPGIAMRLRAMHELTAALPLVELSEGERDGSVATPLTGRSTRASMVAGVCNASVYEIDGFIRDYEQMYPGVKLFLTGGDADFFAKRLFFPNFATSDLMYVGLDKILEMNIMK